MITVLLFKFIVERVILLKNVYNFPQHLKFQRGNHKSAICQNIYTAMGGFICNKRRQLSHLPAGIFYCF